MQLSIAQKPTSAYTKTYPDLTSNTALETLEAKAGVQFNSMYNIIIHGDSIQKNEAIVLLQRRAFEIAERHYAEGIGLYLTWGTNGNCGRSGSFYDDLTADFDFIYKSVHCSCLVRSFPEYVDAYNKYATQYIAKKHGKRWEEKVEAAILKRKRSVFIDYTPEEVEKTSEMSYALRELIEYPKGIEVLENLELLSFNINQLSSLDASICKFKKLKKLRLHANKFESFPEEITCLTTLEELVFDQNQLKNVSDHIGNLKNLNKIYLGNNQITSLPDSFSELTNLTFLDLRNNQLSSLPKGFENIQYLQTLVLWDNDFKSIPESLFKLKYLRMLLIKNGNNISEEDFKKLKKALPNTDVR